jgi:hypothetical protein
VNQAAESPPLSGSLLFMIFLEMFQLISARTGDKKGGFHLQN